jgi:hypothetical protein
MDVISSLCQTLVKHAFLFGFVFESKAYPKSKRIQQQSLSNSKAFNIKLATFKEKKIQYLQDE